MPTTPPTRRRWYQFSLRMVFVVVTVLGMLTAWVGYNLNLIRQRHAYLARIHESASMSAQFVQVNAATDLPLRLWMFGEKGVSQLRFLFGVDYDEGPGRESALKDIAEAERLFPEATVKPQVSTPREHRDFRR